MGRRIGWTLVRRIVLYHELQPGHFIGTTFLSSLQMDWRIDSSRRLSLTFATCCIIDLFGVFPIIALPRPIIDCGWIGIPLAFGVFGLQVYTAVLLGRCWTLAEEISPSIIQKSRYPYPAISELALGKKVGKLVAVLLDVTVFGAGIPNLLIAAQNMQIIVWKVSEGQIEVSFCIWLLILGLVLCPIMWLGSPKDMKWLAVLSVITVASVAMLTWHCILSDPSEEPAVFKEISWESVAIAYGILAFQFDIHPTILSVQMDMERRDLLAQPILASFLGGLFTITTSLARNKYGSNAEFNLLQGLPGSGALYLDLTLVSMQIFLSMVIGTSALFQDVEEKLNIPIVFNSRRCLLRSGLVLLLVILGEAVPRIDLIMGLIGGCLTGPLMFILPPIIYCKLKNRQRPRIVQLPTEPTKTEETSLLQRVNYERLDNLLDCEYRPERSNHNVPVQERLLLAMVVVLGVVATLLATFFTLRNTVLYAMFTPSCIMNMTAASHLLDQTIL